MVESVSDADKQAAEMRINMQKKVWGDGAKYYDEGTKRGMAGLREEVNATVQAEFPKSTAGLRFLDVGTGPGYPALLFAEAYPQSEIVASDFAEGMLDYAKKTAAEKGLKNMKFAVADVQDLSQFPDHSFDVLSCIACIFFFPGDHRALKEFHRVLKPGGFIIASGMGKPEETNFPSVYYKAISNLAMGGAPLPSSDLNTLEGLEQALKEANFSDIHSKSLTSPINYPAADLTDTSSSLLMQPMFGLLVAMLQQNGKSADENRAQAGQEVMRLSKEQGFYDSTTDTYIYPKNKFLVVTARA